MNFENNLLDLFVVIFSSIGIVLGIFFSIFLLANRNHQPKAKIFLILYLLAFSLRIGKSIVFFYHPIDPIIRNVFLGLLLSIGPSVFLYTKYMAHPFNKIKLSKILVHYMPSLLFMSLCFLIPNDGSKTSFLIFTLLNLHIVLYAAYSLFYINRLSVDIDIAVLKWLRLLSVVTLIAGIFFTINPVILRITYISLPVMYSMVVLTLSFWALRNAQLFNKIIPKYANSYLNKLDVDGHMQKLDQLMKNEKLYLDPDLTLAKLSKICGINSKELSQAINQTTQNNYSKYISHLRVEEAKRLLASPENKKYKIAAIAYDSGFNSLSSFNASFKQLTGTTAVEYRQSVLNSPKIGN